MEELASEFGHPTYTPFVVVVARLVLATIFGAVIGFEREWRDRPAGLRTHILICVAAATFAILTIEIVHAPMFVEDSTQFDPLRVVEAVTAGVAFLGRRPGYLQARRGARPDHRGRHVDGGGHRPGLRVGALADCRVLDARSACSCSEYCTRSSTGWSSTTTGAGRDRAVHRRNAVPVDDVGPDTPVRPRPLTAPAHRPIRLPRAKTLV